MQTKLQIARISKHIIQIFVALGLLYFVLNWRDTSTVHALVENQINAFSPPAAPTDLQADMLSATEVRLTWADRSSDETGFIIYDNGSFVATVGIDVDTLHLQNLVFNSSHCYRVNAYNAYGYSDYSNEVCVTVVSSPLPGAATLVSPSGVITDDTPTYTWYQADATSWYYLYVADASGTTILQQWYVSPDICVNGTCSVTPDVSLGNGTYIWAIMTWNENGLGPWSNAVNFSVVSINLQAKVLSATEVILNWTPPFNEVTGFDIYDNGRLIATVGLDVTWLHLQNLISNSSHCYTVKSDNAYGYSQSSNEVCINLTSKPGDANGDGKVDGIDYVIWLSHYGQSTTNGPADGDFDYSGVVDDADYQIWLDNRTG